jgi:signal transduction histidine kinase
MTRAILRKWRPPLTLVLGGTLAAVFALPLLGIGYFRLAGGILGWGETVAIIAAIALTATVALGYLLWRLVLNPVQALTAYAASVTHGDPDPAVPRHFGTPELTDLGRSIHEMSRTLSSREAVLRSYADHATHELRAPLTVMRGALEILADDDLGPGDRARLMTRLSEATCRMEALLDAQRALARARDPRFAGEGRVDSLLPGLRRDHPGVTLVLAADATLPLSEAGLRLVLDHLVSNAAAHGATTVTLTATPDSLTIADDGPGVSPGNRTRIFDPFFTTRREAGGTGMGLAITARLLEAHGAEITLGETCPGPGATFEIRF